LVRLLSAVVDGAHNSHAVPLHLSKRGEAHPVEPVVVRVVDEKLCRSKRNRKQVTQTDAGEPVVDKKLCRSKRNRSHTYDKNKVTDRQAHPVEPAVVRVVDEELCGSKRNRSHTHTQQEQHNTLRVEHIFTYSCGATTEI